MFHIIWLCFCIYDADPEPLMPPFPDYGISYNECESLRKSNIIQNQAKLLKLIPICIAITKDI